MGRERVVVEDDEGRELELTRGGCLLTSILIFWRPDLFEQCPPEVQKALKLYHAGMSMFSLERYEEGRQLMGQAFKLLLSSGSKN
jgi:hypothetical protein